MTNTGHRVATDEKVQQDLRNLADGINFAIASLNGGNTLDFMLILVRPDGSDAVTLNTITGITDPFKILTIGEHLVDMAVAQDPSLDPENDDDVQGHA